MGDGRRTAPTQDTECRYTRVPHSLPQLQAQDPETPAPGAGRTLFTQVVHSGPAVAYIGHPAGSPATPAVAQAITPGAHTCHEYTAPGSPARSHRLSHPRVSRPRLFFWKLCSPLSSPQAGSAHSIFSLSGFRPFPCPPHPPAGDRANASRRGPRSYPPHRHSRGDSRLPPEPRIFPLATWGTGRSPAVNFLLA